MTDKNPGAIPVTEVPELEPFRPPTPPPQPTHPGSRISSVRLEAEIFHDTDSENPNERDEPMLRLVSFSDRHLAAEPIDDVLGCLYDHNGEYTPCGWPEWSHNPEHRTYDPELLDHKYEGRDDVAFTLSYYEHGPGSSVWMVGRSTVSDYGGFDTVQHAGALIVESPDEWAELDEDQQRKYAEVFVSEYTDWINGNVWGYVLTRVTEYEGECPTCDREYEPDREEVDACWGFIGRDGLEEEIKMAADGEKYKLVGAYE